MKEGHILIVICFYKKNNLIGLLQRCMVRRPVRRLEDVEHPGVELNAMGGGNLYDNVDF